MVRKNFSALWEYFDKIGSTKRAACVLCGDTLSFSATTANLKSHLKRKHPPAYYEVVKTQELAKLSQSDSGERNSSVTYEYVIASSPTSSVDEGSTTKNDSEIPARIQSKDSESRSLSSLKRLKRSRHSLGKSEVNGLIEKLTEEKICVANLQKELIEKEMMEKELKITLLQEEMKHKKEINELEKQEMLLKIEILQSNLNKTKGTSLPVIE